MDPAAASVRQRQSLAGTIAHELAHMWFGDLVTMKWWDDLWLNESFASWMGDKIVDEVYPEFEAGLRVRDANSMEILPEARRPRSGWIER